MMKLIQKVLVLLEEEEKLKKVVEVILINKYNKKENLKSLDLNVKIRNSIIL